MALHIYAAILCSRAGASRAGWLAASSNIADVIRLSS
eukprot:SAG31_NODE_15188_length_766_cov_1.292354_1_plen_36_part_01